MDIYEKKYKEALKWMRELYPGLHGATKEDAEHYFPELRESEDERMFNRVIESLVCYRGKVYGEGDRELSSMVEKEIAWMIEQREHEERKKDNPLKDYSRGYNDGYNHGFTDGQMKPARWKPSEEQMEALRRAVNKLANTDVSDSVRLSIMYYNLKKL